MSVVSVYKVLLFVFIQNCLFYDCNIVNVNNYNIAYFPIVPYIGAPVNVSRTWSLQVSVTNERVWAKNPVNGG